jgi:hypothetical protein
VAVVNAAEFDGALRRLREGHAASAALVEDALVGDVIVFRLAAEILSGDFLQFLLCVHGDGPCGAGVCVGGLAAAGGAAPRQVLASNPR